MSESNPQGNSNDNNEEPRTGTIDPREIPEESQDWNSEGALYLLDQISQGQNQLAQQINDLPDELVTENEEGDRSVIDQATFQDTADHNSQTKQFAAFVKSSAIGGVVLLSLFASLFVQGAVSINVAVPAMALLLIIVIGFVGTWYDI
jgi:hypothetical protein